MKHSNFKSLIQFQNTNHFHQDTIDSLILHNVYAMLQDFNLEPVSFLVILWQKNGIVSGSVPLSIMFLDTVQPNDLNLYILKAKLDSLLTYLHQHNFEEDHSMPDSYNIFSTEIYRINQFLNIVFYGTPKPHIVSKCSPPYLHFPLYSHHKLHFL